MRKPEESALRFIDCIDTLPEWSEVVKCFTPECGGKTRGA